MSEGGVMNDTEYDYQWEPGGEALLMTVKAFIRENGGNDRLADKIESEWLKYGKRNIQEHEVNQWTAVEERYLMRNHPIMNDFEIAANLKRSHYGVRRKISQLIKSGN